MLRGEVPRLFDAKDRTQFNQARIISEGEDITLLSSGRCTENVLRANAAIRAKGVSRTPSYLDLKPFDDPIVLEAISRAKMALSQWKITSA